MADNAFKKLKTVNMSSTPMGNGRKGSFFGKSEVCYEPDGSESDVTSEDENA